MKPYGLVGCVALFFFSILHEGHQRNPCSEWEDYNILRVGDEEMPGVSISFTVHNFTRTYYDTPKERYDLTENKQIDNFSP